ncbi:MAG: DMT family transporter [Candidatus Bathyarchaeia archaeon]|jgi:drug/metabolite transporter (DMT)-like permease
MEDNNNTPQSEEKQTGKNRDLPRWFVTFGFAVMVVLFGVRFIAIPISNKGIEPFWGGALRLALAAIVLLFVVAARKPAFPNARGMFFSLIYGFFSVGLNIGLMYWGLLQVSSDIAAIVYAAVPLAVIVLSICFGLEKFRLRLIVGALLGLYGVEVMFGVAMGFGINLVSLIAVIGGAFFNAVGMIAAKKAQKVDPIVMNCAGFALGAAMLFAMSLLTSEAIALPAQQATWLAIGFLVAVSVIGYSLNVYIIQQKSVSYASFSNVLTPLVTIAASSVMFGEEVTPALLVGSGLIFAGLFFSGHLVIKKKPE